MMNYPEEDLLRHTVSKGNNEEGLVVGNPQRARAGPKRTAVLSARSTGVSGDSAASKRVH